VKASDSVNLMLDWRSCSGLGVGGESWGLTWWVRPPDFGRLGWVCEVWVVWHGGGRWRSDLEVPTLGCSVFGRASAVAKARSGWRWWLPRIWSLRFTSHTVGSLGGGGAALVVMDPASSGRGGCQSSSSVQALVRSIAGISGGPSAMRRRESSTVAAPGGVLLVLDE
jgi:hypothetical protein